MCVILEHFAQISSPGFIFRKIRHFLLFPLYTLNCLRNKGKPLTCRILPPNNTNPHTIKRKFLLADVTCTVDFILNYIHDRLIINRMMIVHLYIYTQACENTFSTLLPLLLLCVCGLPWINNKAALLLFCVLISAQSSIVVHI